VFPLLVTEDEPPVNDARYHVVVAEAGSPDA